MRQEVASVEAYGLVNDEPLPTSHPAREKLDILAVGAKPDRKV